MLPSLCVLRSNIFISNQYGIHASLSRIYYNVDSHANVYHARKQLAAHLLVII